MGIAPIGPVLPKIASLEWPRRRGQKATAFGGAAPPGVRTSLAGEFQAGQREFLGPIEFSEAGGGDFLPACPYRKSNPDVLMVQTSEVWGGQQSCRIEPMGFSACPFRHGDRGAIGRS